jgi:hypothetical protein
MTWPGLANGTAALMSPSQWHEVPVGDVLVFSSPIELAPASAQGIDTAVGEWRGDGLLVRIDVGPFVDRLNRYGQQPNYQAFETSIDGRPARGVAFDQADGSRFTAVHFPDLGPVGAGSRMLTFVVITSGGRTGEEARRIVESIRFRA